jgi:hypothetical protein
MSKPLDAALEVLGPVLDDKDPTKALVAAKCVGLMRGYDARWLNAPYLIDAVESVLTADLYNPDSQRKSRTFTTAGKLDVRATEISTGKKVIFDHKTTSEDISDPNSPYWRQLVVEGQATHYMLLEWLNGEKVDAAVWDVIRKPGISPKALLKADVQGYRAGYARGEVQQYFEYPLSADDMESVSVDGRETIRMYAARLAADCISERPQWYFQRRTIPRLDGEVMDYARDQWDIGQDIIHARSESRHPRNSGACMLYRSPCKYLGVCSGHDTIDSEKWVKRSFVHPELPIIEIDDRGVGILTNSRMRTFQTCKRKHFYQYEMGMDQVDAEERETLFFGNLFHEASEQFFLTIMKEQQKG